MLTFFEENKQNEIKDSNIGLAFEDESDNDVSIENDVEKTNSLKNDSVNFSSLMDLLDEPDSLNDIASSLPSQKENNPFLFPFGNDKDTSNNNKNEISSTLKVPVLKTYSSKKTKKIPFTFDDEDENESDNEIKGESKNFTFYGKSKYNKDNLNINTAYSFPRRDKLDEKILNASINDFIRKEDIIGKKEDSKSNEKDNSFISGDKDDYSHIFDVYIKDTNEHFNDNLEKTQQIVEDTQVKDHIMKTIEVIKNDNDNNDSSNIKSFSQDLVATQQLDIEATQPIDSTQIISHNDFSENNVNETFRSGIFNEKDSQIENDEHSINNSQFEEKNQSRLHINNYNISEITETVFDNDKELAQSVMDITEKYKNQTIHDKSELNDIEVEDDSSDEDYDFNKNIDEQNNNNNNNNNKLEEKIEEEKILTFEEWKNEYFSTSGLDTQEMGDTMMLKIYENWKSKKLLAASDKNNEKKKKEKLNKSDIENIRKETDRLTRSSHIELPVRKTKKVTMKNFLAKYSKKSNIELDDEIDETDNVNHENNYESMKIDSKDINMNDNNDDNKTSTLPSNSHALKEQSKSILLNKNIQIEFDDSDDDNDMIIEIEKPLNHFDVIQEEEAKYKTIINSLQQDKNDTLSHSQLVKQLWNKTEQQTKIEREKLERIHKEKMARRALQKEKEQSELLNEQEKEKVLKELDEEDLEVVDKNLLKELNDKKGKRELKRLKKLTFEEIEQHQKNQENKELENKMDVSKSVTENDNSETTLIIETNEIKEFNYGSTQDNDKLAEFFKASNTETNKNNDDGISIWDKLRKGSPVLSEQNESWSPITETAIINKSTLSLTNDINNNDENLEIDKDSVSDTSSLIPTKKIKSTIDSRNDQDDFERLVDINGSDEVNIIPQTSFIKENTQEIEHTNVITQTKIKNNKKEVINIIPNNSKKPNLLMNWLSKGTTKTTNKNETSIQINEKEKPNLLEEKFEDSWDNYEDNNLLQDKKVEEFDDSLGDLSLNNSTFLINKNDNINEKDDEYTVENLDDNVDNYLSDDSFDLSNMLPTQSETNTSQIKHIPKIIDDDDDENVAISIPKIKKKNKKKSVFLEDEAVESEDEELKNLGIVKDKSQDDEEDEESDSNIVYSGDEDEINTDDIDKIIELHRKQMKDKDEKDMSVIINGVTTGNFRKRKRLNDEELEKGYDLSDDDLDIHGLKSLRRFVDRIDPHSHKHKRYKHKGALAIYGNYHKLYI